MAAIEGQPLTVAALFLARAKSKNRIGIGLVNIKDQLVMEFDK